jgi:hypothetical protein
MKRSCFRVGLPQTWQKCPDIPRRCRVTCCAAKLGKPSPGRCTCTTSTSPSKSCDICRLNSCSPVHATDQGTFSPIRHWVLGKVTLRGTEIGTSCNEINRRWIFKQAAFTKPQQPARQGPQRLYRQSVGARTSSFRLGCRVRYSVLVKITIHCVPGSSTIKAG